jgi:GT2 family glycosyltransferase
VLLADYYRHVVAEFERDPGLGAVGGSVLNTSYSGLKWRVRQGLSVVFLLNFWNGRMTPSGFGYPIYHRQIRRRTSVQMLHGCNMTVRRSAFGSAGFDSWFTGYSFREDAELSYRISRRWRVIMIPEAQLYHYESASNRLPSLEHKRMEIRNCEYVARKHRPGWWNGFLFRYSLRGLLLLDWLSAFGAADDRKARYDVARQAVRELRQ